MHGAGGDADEWGELEAHFGELGVERWALCYAVESHVDGCGVCLR